jgi:hypothetical protein
VKRTLLFVCLIASCTLTGLAQTGERPPAVPIAGETAMPQATPSELKVIYSNLGKKGDLYTSGPGYEVYGPESEIGSGYSTFVAMQFTPKSDSHVVQVQVAVQYGGSGANQVNLNIYGSSDGAPGTLLAGPVTVTNLSDLGTCCGLAVASFSPVAVTAGIQYWVVANTPLTGSGSDFLGVWSSISKEIPFAAGNSTGWHSGDAQVLPAGEVLGTIP